MKLARLIEITMILLGKGSATAGELARRFGVSVRTIYRDIDDLSQAGVPVYASRGAGGGIALLPGFALDRALLSPAERDELLLGLKALEASKYPDAKAAAEKLAALFHPKSERQTDSAADWISVSFEPWENNPDEKGRFSAIRSALIGQRVVSFDYINASCEASRRDVEPLQLAYHGTSWYLRGYCRRRCEIRTFRVSRIKSLTVTDKVFERRELPSENDCYNAHEAVKIRLRFGERAVCRVFDFFDEGFIERSDDGSLTVEVEWPEDEWVYGYILSFGGDVEVISPPHMRKIIAEKLQKASDLYKPDI